MEYCKATGQPFATIVQANAEAWWPSDETSARMAGLYPSARRLFCVCHHNLALLEHQIGRHLTNGHVARNPNNVAWSPLLPWPPEDGVFRLACVARLEPAAKGQDLLFQVLASAAWREHCIEVNLYGTGPCERSLRQLASSLGLDKVHFRGQVSDITQIWRTNHLLILPSRWEGLPLALVEAMWCGRPAVVTDVGGNAELCVDGETGFLVAAPAVSLLKQTLDRAWERRSDWQSLGQAARARVIKVIPEDPITDLCTQLVECTISP
jgi:glycosyltransferase involved in cell wall biosynthesis